MNYTDVCAGKMYVEAEDARLHLMLALIQEEDGDIGAACDMIQDVHVETYGALSKLGILTSHSSAALFITPYTACCREGAVHPAADPPEPAAERLRARADPEPQDESKGNARLPCFPYT